LQIISKFLFHHKLIPSSLYKALKLQRVYSLIMQIYRNFPGIQDEISEGLVNVTTEHMNMEMRRFRRIYSI